MFHRVKAGLPQDRPSTAPQGIRNRAPGERVEGKEAEERNEEEGNPNRKETKKCPWKESSCAFHLISRKKNSEVS